MYCALHDSTTAGQYPYVVCLGKIPYCARFIVSHLVKKCSSLILPSITGYKSCYEENWEISLGRPGWTNCTLGRYPNGLWRANYEASSYDGIQHIKRGRCCIPPHEYKDDSPVCQTVDWKTPLSRSVKAALSCDLQ